MDKLAAGAKNHDAANSTRLYSSLYYVALKCYCKIIMLSVLQHESQVQKTSSSECRSAPGLRRRKHHIGEPGIVNLDSRGMLVVSVARRLRSEGPLLAYCAAPL